MSYHNTQCMKLLSFAIKSSVSMPSWFYWEQVPTAPFELVLLHQSMCSCDFLDQDSTYKFHPCLEPYFHHLTQRQNGRVANVLAQQVPEMQFFFLRFNYKNCTVSIICMSDLQPWFSGSSVGLYNREIAFSDPSGVLLLQRREREPASPIGHQPQLPR